MAILFGIFNIFARNFKRIREKDFVFVSKQDYFGYAESSGDIPDDETFKIANWQPFLFDIFNIFALKPIEIVTSFQMQRRDFGVCQI